MKNTILLFLVLFVSHIGAQTIVTTDQWQEDLKFLQETVHNDYSFLFKKISKEDFDNEVNRLHSSIPSLEQHEIIVGLARIVSTFKYGHTSLRFRGNPFPFHQLPLNFYSFNDGIYIQGAHKNYKNAVGAKVIAIAGVPINNALKAVYPVVPAENDQFFKAFGINYLTIPEVLHAQGIIKKFTTSIELTLEKDGKLMQYLFEALPLGDTVPREYSLVKQSEDWFDMRDQSETPYYLKHLNKIYYFQHLPNHKTVYVRQSQIQDDPEENIPDFYERVFDFIENNDIERLVLDLRLNGGGNNYKNKAVITRIIKSEKINQTGKFFVIIGRRTFSACQNLVNEISNYTNAIFVGESTSENINFYGDNNRVELPNSKIPVFLSFAWWQDKAPWENGDWTTPHLAVSMSSEDFKSNKDPVLEASLAFNDTSFIMNPMRHMTDLFLGGKIEQLKEDVSRMINDPNYSFFNFESELNNAGLQQLESGQNQNALFIFQLIASFFPDSISAWNNLAEGFFKDGQKDKSAEHYKKVIAMDPNGTLGKNAKEMLKKMATGQ